MIEKKSSVRRPSFRGLNLAVLSILLHIDQTRLKNWLGLTSAPDISAKDIVARTFPHGDISTCVTFGSADIPAHGHFVSMDILARGLFGIGNFWHKDVSAPEHFDTGIFRHCGHFDRRYSIWTLRHRNITAN